MLNTIAKLDAVNATVHIMRFPIYADLPWSCRVSIEVNSTKTEITARAVTAEKSVIKAWELISAIISANSAE